MLKKKTSKLIEIPGRLIGEGQPCFVIAEAGVNHNGNLAMALKLVDAAADAGADAVKFQKRDLKSLYPPSLLQDPNSAEWALHYMLPILQQTELADDDFRRIKERCVQRNIRFMCTPWDEVSLKLLEELEVELYKVASADLVNPPLIQAIARTRKPLILSTGMATMHEIERAVEYLNRLEVDFALLHCVSTYPAPFEALNLRFVDTLKKFDVPVGYSGHERGIAVPLVALTLGASIIEKHITLDRTLPGPDHPASLEPGGFQRMVRDLRNAETALGSHDKHLNAMEILNRQVLRKSIVASRDLSKGAVVTPEMTRIIGPGKGLSPQRLDELIGVTLERDIKAGAFFTEGDLKPAAQETINSVGLHRPWGLKSRFHDLQEILELKPRVVELHFSEDDVDFEFRPPAEPHPQQLFIHAPEFAQKRLLDLASVNDERREASIALMQRTIDKAVELQRHFTGPVTVVIHVGGMSMDEPVKNTEPLLRRALESFRRLNSKGVTLLPENLPPRPWYLGGQWFQNTFIHAEEMVDFCKELGLGMALDISHAQLYCTAYGKDLAQFVKTCLPAAKHLHLADASGIDSEGLQIGEGVVEWEVILEMLSHADFTWVPEIWSGHLHRASGFIQAVNRLAAFGRL